LERIAISKGENALSELGFQRSRLRYSMTRKRPVKKFRINSARSSVFRPPEKAGRIAL
jgi:hypothetical protein